MKRGFLIAAAVLVPFVVLVFLGFWFAPELPLPAPAGKGAVSLNPLVVEVAPHPDPRPAGRERENTEPPRPKPPEPIRAVEAEVHRCFADNRLTGTIRVRFTPNRDGGYDDVNIEANPSQSPYLAACLEDVLAEMRFVPAPGERYEPTIHTFSFGAPKD